MSEELDELNLPQNELDTRGHQVSRCLRLARVTRHWSLAVDLADMMRVSERTIRRDMHCLTRAGCRVYKSTDNAQGRTSWKVSWP